MSEGPENKKFTVTKLDDDASFKSTQRYGFAQLLDIVSILSLVGGVICSIALTEDGNSYYSERNGTAVIMYLIGGCLSALWLHTAAIVVEACAKYLGKK